MKILLISVTLLATAMLFWFCKQPKYSVGKFPDKQLRWGSGGGFVGRENTFILLENGQIFKSEGKDKMTELDKTKAGKAKKLFEHAKALDLAKRNFEHPSNLYSFLEYQEGDMVQRITWGDPKYPVDARVNDLFTQLNAQVKK
ncbi:MAG: hypothetical protein ABIQ93_12475 [Saprospiraceae bacterium]